MSGQIERISCLHDGHIRIGTLFVFCLCFFNFAHLSWRYQLVC